MFSLLAHVAAVHGDALRSVIETSHQSPLHMPGVVGAESKVMVCVCWFSIYGDVQTTTLPPLYTGVQKRKGAPSFHLHSEPY